MDTIRDSRDGGTISFTGIYDPIDPTIRDMESLIDKAGDEITGTIHADSGETREARLKISIEGRQVCLTPIDEDVKNWVKDKIFHIYG